MDKVSLKKYRDTSEVNASFVLRAGIHLSQKVFVLKIC